MRGVSASAILSEFCTVQVLEGLKNLFILQNSEMSAFGSIVLMALQLGQCQVVAFISEVIAIGKCLLREAVLSNYTWVQRFKRIVN